jgi:hypothetical protein
MAAEAEAEAAAADDSATTAMFVYTGIDVIPPTVTHLIVDPCVEVIPPASCLHCVRLTQVQLPVGLETIGSRAFSCCQALKSIDLPTTVRDIGYRAFHNCCALKEIVLPRGLLKLGDEAFESCRSLESIHIPPLIRIIEPGTFSGCSSLTDVVFLGANLNEIKTSAFQGCYSLQSIEFPSSLRIIGKLAFHRAGLTEFNLPDSVEDCGSFKDCQFPNLRMPSITSLFDTSIFELRAHNNIISIELPENVNQVVFPDSVNARLPRVQNIAYPVGCSVHIADDIKETERLYLHGLVHQLKHRFDGLPLHKICYYHSYHDTAEVLLDMSRTMFPGSIESRRGEELNAAGAHQDFFGMTPLHILACSTTQRLEMYQLLVEHYPENLLVEDMGERIPFFYAIWFGAPSEIIEFLAESYKAKHPEYILDWEDMVERLMDNDASPPHIQVLLDTHDRSFPDQELNMTRLVIRLARGLDNNAEVRAAVPISKFQFLLRASIAKRVESLNVTRSSVFLYERINMIPFLPGKLEDKALELYEELEIDGVECQKEVASLLELALWKSSLVDQQARINDEDTYRTQCRVNCGADVVIPNVQHFLGWSNDQAG